MDNSLKSAALVGPAAARIIPFAAFILFIVLESMAGEWLRSQGVDTRWLYGARAITVGCLLLIFWRYYTELHHCTGITVRQVGIAVTTGMLVFALWINLDQPWATLGKPSSFDPTSTQGSGYDGILIFFRLLGLAIVVPVMEELFWRSYLLRRVDAHDFLACDPAKVSLYAIVITAVLFASEHHQWLAGLIAGLAYTLVYRHGRNLWLPIVGHAVTNAALGWWILVTGQWQFW
jgi:CAAX prenyl protease-like protein